MTLTEFDLIKVLLQLFLKTFKTEMRVDAAV